ncbi:unnamed protein product [Camellia sinensis]
MERELRATSAKVEKAARRNAELSARAAHQSAEAQAWQARARAQEAMAAALQERLQQAIMSGGGGGEAEDAESAYIDPDRVVRFVGGAVEQKATRLLGNLGWALMQQNNYIEAEDAYHRALLIAPDNNKMCNLGICLMKQGRIAEAKETLRRVKPAAMDGPRGVDSHLKAYERAQQMLRDLESEMMNKSGGDREM